ncbi:hypothetical protein [Motiliproteus sp. SC1-56]|uniref:hypothetical protein n=1 Tax=Motiliproteus sp. SC1-56 TaxID=2799565 RepID=UPI001A8E4A1A|nr:hypothetical protein [Motiliproteus sp. SC1-56]
MEYYDVQLGYQMGALKEAIIEPGSRGNGWVILFRDVDDSLSPLTNAGQARIFHNLDNATRLAKDLGFRRVSVLEHF